MEAVDRTFQKEGRRMHLMENPKLARARKDIEMGLSQMSLKQLLRLYEDLKATKVLYEMQSPSAVEIVRSSLPTPQKISMLYRKFAYASVFGRLSREKKLISAEDMKRHLENKKRELMQEKVKIKEQSKSLIRYPVAGMFLVPILIAREISFKAKEEFMKEVMKGIERKYYEKVAKAIAGLDADKLKNKIEKDLHLSVRVYDARLFAEQVFVYDKNQTPFGKDVYVLEVPGAEGTKVGILLRKEDLDLILQDFSSRERKALHRIFEAGGRKVRGRGMTVVDYEELSERLRTDNAVLLTRATNALVKRMTGYSLQELKQITPEKEDALVFGDGKTRAGFFTLARLFRQNMREFSKYVEVASSPEQSIPVMEVEGENWRLPSPGL